MYISYVYYDLGKFVQNMDKGQIKQEYLDILIRIAPGPIGQGMTIPAAAKDLGIGYKAAKYRLKQFKIKYPNAWGKIKELRRIAKSDRYKLAWKRHPNQKVGLRLFTELQSDAQAAMIPVNKLLDKIVREKRG